MSLNLSRKVTSIFKFFFANNLYLALYAYKIIFLKNVCASFSTIQTRPRAAARRAATRGRWLAGSGAQLSPATRTVLRASEREGPGSRAREKSTPASRCSSGTCAGAELPAGMCMRAGRQVRLVLRLLSTRRPARAPRAEPFFFPERHLVPNSAFRLRPGGCLPASASA